MFSRTRFGARLAVIAALAVVMMVTCGAFRDASAAISLTSGSPATQNFDALGIIQTATLPTDWRADKNATARTLGTWAAGATATEQYAGTNMGSSAANGIYNYGAGVYNVATDRALGFISSGTATKSGNIYAYYQNNTGSANPTLTISYNVEKYRMGTNAAGYSVQMYYSYDGSTWTSAGTNFLTSFAGGDASNSGYTTAPGATSSVTAQTLSTTVASGGYIYLAWNYSVTSGSTTSNAQALGIDDVSVTASGGGGVTTPATQASNLTFGAVTATMEILNWASGDGANRIVVAKAGSAVTGVPVDGTAYTAAAYGAGSTLSDGSYVVYNGNLATATVSGLSPSTTYYYAVFEYNGSGTTTKYLTTSPAANSQMTGAITTYTWAGGASASWATAGSWSPSRPAGDPTDILQFNSGGTVQATNVSTQAIARLLVSNSTTVDLQAASGNILTLAGASGTDLDVPAGSALNISGTNALQVYLGTGATGSISGAMTFTNGAHTLDAADAGGITFNSGAVFTQGTATTGAPFTSAGTANAVVFASGATFVTQSSTANSPFGLTQPASKVVFQTGSLYRHESTGFPGFSGRTYADFEVNAAGYSNTHTGSSPCSIDNLTVTQGAIHFRLTSMVVKGNISVASGQTLAFDPTATATITLGGASPQSMTNNGGTLTFNSFANVTVNNAAGVVLNSPVTLEGPLTFTSGSITTGSNVLTAIGAITGAGSGTGWVNGNLQRPVSGAGTVDFAVGGASDYGPVSLAFASVGGAGNLTAAVTTLGSAPPTASGLSSSKYVNRMWTFTNGGIASPSYQATFNYASGDLLDGAVAANLVVAKNASGTWSAPGVSGTPTSTQLTTAAGLTSFSDFYLGEPAAVNYTLTVQADPTAGGTVTGGGSYASGTVANVSATAAANYHFVNWTGDVADANSASTTVTVDADKTVTANFALDQHLLTVQASPTGGGTVTGGGTYDHGTVVAVSATAAAHYHFVNWTGDVADANSASTTVTVDAAKTVTANFALDQFALTVDASPVGGGTVTGAGTYDYGSTVAVTATAASGYVFANWTGDVADANSASTTVTVDAAKTVTANFNALPVRNTDTGLYYATITAAINDPLTLDGHVIVAAAGTYHERVTINKSVDLRGAQYGVDPTTALARTDPALESVVDAVGLPVPNPDVLIEIPAGTTNVHVSGFTLVGGQSLPHNADQSAVRCWDDHITLQDNIIDGYVSVLYKGNDYLDVLRNRITANKAGVIVQPNVATHVTVTGNRIERGTSPAGDESAIYLTGTSDAVVSGNTSTGFLSGRVVQGSAVTRLELSGNHFTGNRDAISIFGNSTFITISGNDLSSNTRYGINIKGADIVITDNFIRLNGDAGVSIDKNTITTERVRLTHNDITGNTNYGIKVVDPLTVPETINAECNWFGNVDGPNAPSNAGHGDQVTSTVDFTPWLDGSIGGTPSCNLPQSLLTVLASPVEGGTVTGGGTYGYGASATIEALPAAGYHFVEWTGDVTGSTNPTSLTMDGAKSVTAHFEADTPLLVTNTTRGLSYATIQAAIDATETQGGDQISVAAGTFVEQVVVTKALTITGAGCGSTIIRSPATLAQSFTTSGPNTNKPVVFVNGVDATIQNLTIDGAGLGNANVRFVGLAFYNGGGEGANLCIQHVEDTPFSGAQHGVGVYAYNSTGGPYAIELDHVAVTDFQKTGIALMGEGLTVNVHDCTTTGQGYTDVTAQNGIQLSDGATGAITACKVTDLGYTGGTWAASGLLVSDASGSVTVSNLKGTNRIENCQAPINWYNASGTIDGVEIANSARGAWQCGIYALNDNASLASATTAPTAGRERPAPASPFEGGSGAEHATTGTLSSSYSLAVTNCCLTGTDATSTVGVGVYSAGGGMDLTVTRSSVKDWAYGIVHYGGPATLVAHENAITSNTDAGLWGNGTTNAERNWWGDATGPSGAGAGSGDAAYDADITPWIHSGTNLASGCSFTPPTYTLVASAGAHGGISPDGTTTAYAGDDVTYTITPDPTYAVSALLVDGASVTPATSYTFTNVADGHTIAASFALAQDNTVAAIGDTLCLTPVRTCLSVPVNITRSGGITDLRLFHVNFTLSPELKLCGNTGNSVLEGTYLSSANPSTTFFVLDNGGGSYTADGTINGLPCGQDAASGTLFTIRVASNGGTGTGTVTVDSLVLRDCMNNDILPAAGGAPAVIHFDATPVAIADIADETVAELATLTVTPSLTLGDCADGPATWSIAPALPAGATFSGTSGQIVWTPDCSQAGSYGPFTLTATAASGESDTEAFSILVTDTPGTVAVTGITSPYTVEEKSALAMGAPGVSLAGCAAGLTPTWTLSGAALPSGASFSGTTGQITWTPACGQVGTYGPFTLTATVTAAGGQSYSGTADFSINVTHKAGTVTVAAISTPQTVEEQSALTVTPSASTTDCASSVLTWSVTTGTLPGWATFDSGTGAISFAPGCGDAGGYGPFVLTATSATGEVGASNAFGLTVTHKVGTVTVAAISTPQTVEEQSTLTITPSASATPCAGTLTWSVTTGTLPGWASFDSGTGAITANPGYGTAGLYGPFGLTATAATGEVGTSNPFTIQVTHLAGTVTVAAISTPQTVVEKSTLTITPSATTSPSVGTLTWSADSLPGGATFSGTTGEIVWTPACGQVGTYGPYVLTATATTGEVGTSNAFTIQVTHLAGTVTVAAITTPQTVAEMSSLTVTPSAGTTDCASSVLTWSVTTGTLPGWATFSSSTGAISFAPGCTDAGSYGPFALTATSATGESGASNEFDLTVTNAPQTIGVPTTVSAAQVRTGNAAGDTTGITIYFTPPAGAASYKIYRAAFGHYPEYDDDGGAAPTAPTAYPPGAGWVETGVTVQGGTDQPPYRDFWYYVVYAVNACGDISTPSAMTTGTLDYHLGDVTDGTIHGLGDNLVQEEDISELGAHYGTTLAHVGATYAYLDVGPTTTHYVDGRPLTDDRINFEDLVMFAINFGTVTTSAVVARPPVAATGLTPAATDALVLQSPDAVTMGALLTVPLRMQGTGLVQAVSARLSWDATVVEPVGQAAGDLLLTLNGVALSPEPGAVDIAVLGEGRGVIGDGTLATVTFRVIANGDPRIRIESVDARDTRNNPILLSASRELLGPALPTVTTLSFAQPNPFRSQVTLAFSLAERGPVSLRIYSVDGRLVRTLVSGSQDAGYYRPVWDGRDDQGHAMSAGVFYARLVAGRVRMTRTMSYLK
jgi:hypothetical protein